MKKIMIKKFGEYPATSSSSNDSSNSNSPNPEHTAFQPPLPKGPPPPDNPTGIRVKQEFLDDGFTNNSETINLGPTPTSYLHTTSDPRPMCRRYVRGTCTKGTSCRYKHEIVVSQLKGIFKFCWDFQNKVCEREVCRHIHATVFEEQKFLRTGYLPPEASAHIPKENPENPGPHSSEKYTMRQNNYMPQNNVMYQNNDVHQNNMIPQNNIMHQTNGSPSNSSTNSATSSSQYDFFGGMFKHPWDGVQANVSSSEDVANSRKPIVKKCSQCEVNEFRVEMLNNKMKASLRSIESLKESAELIRRKNNRLNQCLQVIQIFKAFQNNSKPSTSNGSNGGGGVI